MIRLFIISTFCFLIGCNLFKPYKIVKNEVHYVHDFTYNDRYIAFLGHRDFAEVLSKGKSKNDYDKRDVLVVLDLQNNFTKFEQAPERFYDLENIDFLNQNNLVYSYRYTDQKYNLRILDTLTRKITKDIEFKELSKGFRIVKIISIDEATILLLAENIGDLHAQLNKIDETNVKKRIEVLSGKDQIFFLYDLNKETVIKQERLDDHLRGIYSLKKASKTKAFGLYSNQDDRKKSIIELEVPSLKWKPIYTVDWTKEKLYSHYYIKDRDYILAYEVVENTRVIKVISLKNEEIQKEIKLNFSDLAITEGDLYVNSNKLYLPGIKDIIAIIDLDRLEVEKYIRIPNMEYINFIKKINDKEILLYSAKGLMAVWQLEDFLKLEGVKDFDK